MMVVITVMAMMRDSLTSAADPVMETEDETTFFLPERLPQCYQPLQKELPPYFEKKNSNTLSSEGFHARRLKKMI